MQKSQVGRTAELNYRQWSSKKNVTQRRGPVYTFTEQQMVKDCIVKTISCFHMHQITSA